MKRKATEQDTGGPINGGEDEQDEDDEPLDRFKRGATVDDRYYPSHSFWHGYNFQGGCDATFPCLGKCGSPFSLKANFLRRTSLGIYQSPWLLITWSGVGPENNIVIFNIANILYSLLVWVSTLPMPLTTKMTMRWRLSWRESFSEIPTPTSDTSSGIQIAQYHDFTRLLSYDLTLLHSKTTYQWLLKKKYWMLPDSFASKMKIIMTLFLLLFTTYKALYFLSRRQAVLC